MIKKFNAYKPFLQNSYTYSFHNLNEFILDAFTKKLGFSKISLPIHDINKVHSNDLFNRTPFIFGVPIDENKNLDDLVYQEVSKINQVLSIYTKNYDFYIYKNLDTNGDHILFRNWVNGQDGRNKALTIIEKVNMKSVQNDNDYCYSRNINQNLWYPSLLDFDSYKKKETLTQKLGDKTLSIE